MWLQAFYFIRQKVSFLPVCECNVSRDYATIMSVHRSPKGQVASCIKLIEYFYKSSFT